MTRDSHRSLFIVTGLLFLGDTTAINLRRPLRELQPGRTTEYFVLMHLSLEYVNDSLAEQFEISRDSSRQSDAVRHFCDSVSQQAGGNQVAVAAEENGVSVKTAIAGSEKQDFQCEIAYAGRIQDSEPGGTLIDGSKLFAFGVTVEQIVYVTANQTLSLGTVTSIVESGFNRGKGGRVRFRSLLQDHQMFATVANVEVLDGALTRHPTPLPTDGSPTDTPSIAPSLLPTLGPTLPVTKEPTRLPSVAPTPAPVIFTAISSQPLTLPPTKYPSNDENSPVSPAASAKDAQSGDGVLDPMTLVAITGSSFMIVIASLCVLCLWYNAHRRKAEGREGKPGKAGPNPSRRRRKRRRRSNAADLSDEQVPGMVQLDEDNRSLANTTLGDQTAGGLRREIKSRCNKKGQNPGSNGMLDSFDDNSLYTTRQVSVLASPSAEFTDTSKHGVDSNLASSISNSAMLPPSIMSYEEASLNMFQVEDVNSVTTSSGSGNVQSSLLSQSITSSSIVESDVHQRLVDVYALETSGQQENLYGIVPISNRDSGCMKEKSKEQDTKKASVDNQGNDGGFDATSRFSPFETNEILNCVTKLNLGKHSKINSSFRSLEEDTATSVASSTSGFTKKAKKHFFFGFQPPPEDYKCRDSRRHYEEEKREIECETCDDDKADGDLLATPTRSGREGRRAHLPLDLLADHRLLERSPSHASWSSWKMPQEKSSKPRDARHSANQKDNSKPAPLQDLKSGTAHKAPCRNQFLGGGATAFSTPDFRHFAPLQAGETKEASLNEREKLVPEEDKKDSPLSAEKDALTAAFSGPNSTTEAGRGILVVQPRNEADALDARSGSSSSTGQHNPWLFETVEQTLGPRSVTADIESLSGRSNLSGKSHRSTRSRQSHRSLKSSRSYNVGPSGKYKGGGDGRIRSAAASVASYGGSSSGRKSAYTTPLTPRTLNHDLTRLEMQLAALRSETDQVTASSITLSSVGAKTRSTRSSKLTHTGAKIIRKRRVIVEVPPGKLGIVLANRHDGKGTVVSEVRPGSNLKGMLSRGDKLVAIDGEDIQGLTVNEITEIMTKKDSMERLLTVITSMHQETISIGTL